MGEFPILPRWKLGLLSTGILRKYFYNLIDYYGINAADFFGLFYINA